MRRLPLLCLPLLLAACGGTQGQVVSSDDDVTLEEAGWTDPDGRIEPGTLETPQSLVDHLRAMGRLAKLTGGPVLQPLFEAASAEMIVDNEFVYVYEFADAETARAAAGTITDNGAAVDGKPVVPEGPVHFFAKDKLIAVYVGANAELAGRLRAVMGEPIARR